MALPGFRRLRTARGIVLLAMAVAVPLAVAAPAKAVGVASACTTSQSIVGSNVIVSISTVGTCTWEVPGGVFAIDLLVVGGGGGGGGSLVNNMAGGGGGGGEAKPFTALNVTPGAVATVVIGDGGAGGNGGSTNGSALGGSNGASSSFTIAATTRTALGGGGGGASKDVVSYPSDPWRAKTGGPGGGGGSNGNVNEYCAGAPGSADTGNGGSALGVGVAPACRNSTASGAGGGGGAVGNGGNGSGASGVGVGGAGGTGLTWQGTVYGGGGGGGVGGDNSSTRGAGGSGGGGAGGFVNTVTFGSFQLAENGTDGLGGGGGGAFGCCGGQATGSNPGGQGGSGGSGIVRIMFVGAAPTVTTASSVAGTVLVGEVLTGTPATFAGVPTPSVSTSAWYSCTTSGAAAVTLPVGCVLITGASTTTLTIGDAQNGSYIRYASTATNGVPSDVTSFSATTSIVPVVPDQPTSLSATPGDGRAVMSFTPGADGGSPIVNYEYSLDGGSWTALSPVDATSPVTIVGLTNGTTYAVRLRAVNGVGSGAASASVNVTPQGVPAAPTGLSATAGDGTASIAFTVGADNGSAIVNYEYSLDGGSWTALSPVDATSPVTIVGLTNGTTYAVRLRAVNGVGSGAASASVSVTPTGPPNPGPSPTPRATVTIRSQAVGATSVRQRVRVSGPGVVRMRGTLVGTGTRFTDGDVVCSGRRTAGRAGVISVDCKLGPDARRLLERRSLRVRVVTIFQPQIGDAVSQTRVVRFTRFQPAPPEPVTG